MLSTWRSEVSYIIVVPSLSGLQLQSKGHLPPNIILYNPRNRRWGGQRSNLDNSSMWPDLSVVAQTDLRSSRNPRTEEFTYLSRSMKELYFTNGRFQENESGRHGAAPHCRLFFICLSRSSPSRRYSETIDILEKVANLTWLICYYLINKVIFCFNASKTIKETAFEFGYFM